MRAPRPIQSGELVGPWLNELLAYVQSCTRVTAGPGITVRQGEEGIVISTTPGLTRRIPATLYGGPSPDTPLLPSAVAYKARPVPPYGDTQGITVARPPDYGRPVRGDAVKVWPHPEGASCWIITRPHPTNPGETLVELEVPTEKINFGPCPPPEASPSEPPEPPEAAPPGSPELPDGGASVDVAATEMDAGCGCGQTAPGGGGSGAGGGSGSGGGGFLGWPESLLEVRR